MVLDAIGIGDIHPLSFRPFLDACFRDRGDRACPPVAAIDPFVVPAMAANVILPEVVGDTFACRVIGDAIRQIVGRDLRGFTALGFLGDAPCALGEWATRLLPDPARSRGRQWCLPAGVG